MSEALRNQTTVESKEVSVKTYECIVPLAGVSYVTVEVPDDADNDAIFTAALDELGEMSREERESVTEWEYHRVLNDGWVSHVQQNEFEAEDITDPDDD